MTDSLILVVGAGGHARACLDVIERTGKYVIYGLIGTENEIGMNVLNAKVIGKDSDLPKFLPFCPMGFVAVGQIKNFLLRQTLFMYLKECGYRLPTLISPNAYVSPHAQIGQGTIVMHGAVINAGARVGDNCIINSQSLVEHDAVVASHCHISTGAIINGAAKVGEGSFVGSRCSLKEGISLGKNCIVGMGLVVRRHQPDETHFLSSDDG